MTDDTGPVAGARVGWQGECRRVTTDSAGRFFLPASPGGKRLIASKPGYRIAAGSSDSLRLAPLPREDNLDYAWIEPHPDPVQINNCANCHDEIYQQWRGSAHGRSASNPRFLHLFAGTDGKSLPRQTWNARAEHPDGSAVCASCHAPTLASPTLEYDVREAQGVARSGVHCDFCHKVADVPPGKFGTRFGRDAVRLLRPRDGVSLTFGPLDDAVRPGETFAYSPLYKESRYCASCHEGIVFGAHAYGTYSEWLASPARAQGKHCQSCHMAPTGKMNNIAPGKGGIVRDPRTLASHDMPGGRIDLLRESLRMDVGTSTSTKGKQVAVEIVAQRVGHRVPTGFVDRHLLLVVQAWDEQGKAVALVDGPRLPKKAGRWSGIAGALYAKQLFGPAGEGPIPFWLHVAKIEDTRLHAERPDRRVFLFSPSARRVSVQLWYRRFWQEVADPRGWTDYEFLVAERKAAWR
ncbi:MAG: hypothetical protein HYX68_21615 [Planctomycetes bacterium]|nr:hypothetical protein [Planctomycetota bacterium]